MISNWFRAGDGSLFRRLVAEQSPRLLAVTRSFARDLDEAHDLLQETWSRAYEKRATFSGSGTLLGWLYAVCRSVCLAAARRPGLAPSSGGGRGVLGPAPA